ncbi:SDR family oxidoreductase [Lentiprolixibacter aurantiacus]|uniref:SDR family oxidoreductase n=1 Tax=Lentiprolixibacter aurantiacus TaxID=2993939 RepID=A0AAE3MLP7_9FLAO|nr:SDR family oxidoreductase [Lentiprolixibacter aurantiacus]MCX2719646.1 SDR family oxidoreductase [Lentiprolixibacter aurantiacus]
MSDQNSNKKNWCLILGASSGLGLATAKKMGSEGYGLLLVHRDRRADMPGIEDAFESIKATGCPLISFNQDAIQEVNRKELVAKLADRLRSDQKISVVVHSIARGNLKPMGGTGDSLSTSDLQVTINSMALSLYDWIKDLIAADLLDSDTRVLAFTSEGNTRVWEGYGAVSAAKVALESLVRQMAVEFAPLGIRCNCIQAGVTDTPSLRMIPGSEKLIEAARKRNPNRRITRAEDVGNVVYLLSRKEAAWITGTVIKADGGESLR